MLEQSASSTPDPDTFEVAALRSAEAITPADAKAVAAFLYRYNRIPTSPRWTRWFHDSKDAASRVGLGDGFRPRDILQSEWRPMADEHWLEWTRADADRWGSRQLRAKLYVSPQPNQLPEVVPAVLEVCTRLGAGRLKIGRTLPNLLRPDKLVIYWTAAGDACAAGRELLAHLRGVAGHRAPFTARVQGSDVLSWGMDPPTRDPIAPWQRPSWRGWVVKRLAVALVRARADDTLRIPAWEHALWRVRQDGIDTDTWAPRSDSW